MKTLDFTSVLIGKNYSKDFTLPDFLRDTKGAFSREKTLECIVHAEYGKVDETGVKITAEDVTKSKTDAEIFNYRFCEKVKYSVHRFSFEKGGKHAEFEVDFLVPVAVENPNVVVMLDFAKALPSNYCPVEELLDNRLAIAHVYYNEITTDNGDFSTGIAPIFSDRSDPFAPGKIALWAYAAGKIGEYLLQNGYAVKDRLYVAGHSRLGKTALLAAAEYDFFAGCMVNCSGCCGAAIARQKHGESIKVITDVFGYWFTEDFKRYAEKENEMPFDQHFLEACVAPRKIFVVAASEDDWADTDAQYLCSEAASAAYKEQGLAGLASLPKMLETGERNAAGDIKFFVRKGAHYFSRADWAFYVDCIDN